MRIIVSPLLPSIEEAIDWLTERGAFRFLLWQGPDGTVRGNGVLADARQGALFR